MNVNFGGENKDMSRTEVWRFAIILVYLMNETTIYRMINGHLIHTPHIQHKKNVFTKQIFN